MFLLTTDWWVPLVSALSIVGMLLSVVAVGHILRQRGEPVAMLAWIFAVLLVPGLGAALYLLLGERRVRRRVRRQRKRGTPAAFATGKENGDRVKGRPRPAPGEHSFVELDPGLRRLARTSTRLGTFPLTAGNRVEVFTSSENVYERLLESLRSAREHVHVEYYIFRQDETGRIVRDALVDCARRGLEVRLLVDGIGSWRTSDSFFSPLRDAGAHVAKFLPGIPWRHPSQINCRNHRKIVVVDGATAFTGSQNIGDEHLGLIRRMTPWKDTHLCLAGPACRDLQETFIEDWFFATGEDLSGHDRYTPTGVYRGTSFVQIVPSGPDQQREVLTHIFFSALALAKERIRVSTPYFVPDRGLILALQNAAYRGVEVDVLIPSRTDHHLTLWAGRSFYGQLVRSGVHVYEFDQAMLHSKTVTIDGRWSLVGSANMDIRSFLLNFEVTATIFDEEIAAALDSEFDTYCRQSRAITRKDLEQQSLPRQLLEGAARLFSPLL